MDGDRALPRDRLTSLSPHQESFLIAFGSFLANQLFVGGGAGATAGSRVVITPSSGHRHFPPLPSIPSIPPPLIPSPFPRPSIPLVNHQAQKLLTPKLSHL